MYRYDRIDLKRELRREDAKRTKVVSDFLDGVEDGVEYEELASRNALSICLTWSGGTRSVLFNKMTSAAAICLHDARNYHVNVCTYGVKKSCAPTSGFHRFRLQKFHGLRSFAVTYEFNKQLSSL